MPCHVHVHHDVLDPLSQLCWWLRLYLCSLAWLSWASGFMNPKDYKYSFESGSQILLVSAVRPRRSSPDSDLEKNWNVLAFLQLQWERHDRIFTYGSTWEDTRSRTYYRTTQGEASCTGAHVHLHMHYEVRLRRIIVEVGPPICIIVICNFKLKNPRFRL